MSKSCGSRTALRTESASERSRNSALSTAAADLYRLNPAAFVPSFVGPRMIPAPSFRGSISCAPLGRASAIRPCLAFGPGGESLLRLAAWRKVVRVLEAIDIVETLGIDPADAAPEHWRHVHNRLFVNDRPRSYTQTRPEAWLQRRKLKR